MCRSTVVYDFVWFQGAAKGSLYIDDYHTFNYRQGEYLLRDFSFDQNEFRSQ
jgi:hypothetical protein